MSWSVVGESVIGTAHRGRGNPCQDACRTHTLGPDGAWLVVAAADGAGSASHAEIGAARVCEALVDRVEAAGPDTLIMTSDAVADLFADVRAAVLADAERLGVRPRELASTALLAVVGPASAVFAQLGDGAIVLPSHDDFRTVFWPEPGEYANVTDFLTDERYADALRIEMMTGPTDAVAVLTDGLQRLALDFGNRVPHAPFFRPLLRELRTAADPGALGEPLRAFLDSDRVNDRTDDDKTLVLAARRHAPADPR